MMQPTHLFSLGQEVAGYRGTVQESNPHRLHEREQHVVPL